MSDFPKPGHNAVKVLCITSIPLTNEIRNDNPVSSSHKRRDHLPVEKRPSGLSMETKNHRTILWSLVEIVHPWQGHPTTSLYKWEGVLRGTYIDAVVVWCKRISEFFKALEF